MIRVPHVVACPMDFNLLYDRDQQGGMLKPTKVDRFSVFLAVRILFSSFGQVKGWDILEMHEMIRISYLVACPLAFNLFCDRGQQGGVLKPTKNDHFLVFLVVWVLFHKFLGRLRSDLYYNCMK